MNRSEIITSALAYADRTDPETLAMMSTFIPEVEARINRRLRTMEMVSRTTVLMVKDQHYFGLPAYFNGIRDIEVRESDAVKGQTAIVLNPEQMNSKTTDDGCIYYSIIANQIQIYPPQDGKVLELIHYQKLKPLILDTDSNWLSEDYPDAYIRMIHAHIEMYVKNFQSAEMLLALADGTLGDIESSDDKNRWGNGTPMTIKVG